MNVRLPTNRKLIRVFANILGIFTILAVALPVIQIAYAVSTSPFLGYWQSTAIEGSDMRLTVSGSPTGPFAIAWTQSSISSCNREPGIIRGTGQRNESDPNFLDVDLHLECFTTRAALDFHFEWRYHPVTNTLSGQYDDGLVTVWRPVEPQAPPPVLKLRVNYGHDWVESFYEADHTAWVTVTESDGVTVKGTAELITEAKAYWGGETGFQSLDSVWFDAEGNQLESPPDIRPSDRVFGWVDNGVSAQVQIGDIDGTINLAGDSIEGTISALWFSNGVEVDCHSWGAPLPSEILKSDTIQANGEDTYSCSWAGEWDIQPYQDVGVGYFGPDGHWVANAFFRDGTIRVTSTADVTANDGVCTLREAIIAANLNSPSGDVNGECPAGTNSETDRILLAPSQTYSLTIDRTNADTEVDGDLDIVNNSADIDLVIRVEGDGKAIISQDALSVDDRVLENHEATVQIENLTITGGSNVGGGGGLLNNGGLNMIGSEVSGNSVGWDGGGIYNSSAGTLNMDSSTVADNSSSAFAGGIMNKGTLTINNSVITANTDLHGGGGINNEGTLTVDNSVLLANSSGQGGALYNTGTATITHTTVGGLESGEGNIASDGGGGLFNLGTLLVDNSIVSGNRAPYGGGLFNWTGGKLTISNSTASGNSANQGGGLHNKEGSTATIQNGSIFSGNYAEWSGGGIDNSGTMIITGSVLRGNRSPGVGDAIRSFSDAVNATTVTASCIVGNEETTVFNERSAPQNFTGNWWGDASGPGGRGPGFGDSVSDYIDFSRWLAEPPLICTP